MFVASYKDEQVLENQRKVLLNDSTPVLYPVESTKISDAHSCGNLSSIRIPTVSVVCFCFCQDRGRRRGKTSLHRGQDSQGAQRVHPAAAIRHAGARVWDISGR